MSVSHYNVFLRVFSRCCIYKPFLAGSQEDCVQKQKPQLPHSSTEYERRPKNDEKMRILIEADRKEEK